MLFNSFEFLVFLPVIFLLYWLVFSKSKVSQNIFLLVVSYVFYSFWDWRFSFLLAFSTILDFYSGSIIHDTNDHIKKKMWMRLSIFINIGLLCYFKYLNFFIDSFTQLLTSLDFQVNTKSLEIILPIGISFYTFHGVSYVLDIYYGRIKADTKLIDYSLFVSFFPLLVAGPIERATHLLPQLKRKKEFNYQQAVDGCRLILWGMFKKVIVADSLAPIVDQIFKEYQYHHGITLIIAAIAFTFQVYADFSGYTDIARGVSKLLGIELILNFNYPFFSKTIPEFWSRWHISLSSWLNDYVFTPLALKFRDFGKLGIFSAVFLTFGISGFWHGSGWNYIVWGMINGLFYIPFVFSKKGLKGLTKNGGNNQLALKDIPKVVLTFSLYAFSMIFFRAENLNTAINYINHIFVSLVQNPQEIFSSPGGKTAFLFIIPFLLLDWFIRKDPRNLRVPKKAIVRDFLYAIFLILIFNALRYGKTTSFVYFEF
jgi:alginate O-acetyltransferase complex protein AlgI